MTVSTITRGKATQDIEDNGTSRNVETVQLKQINIQTFTLNIEGTSSLIVHKFSEKARKKIEDKQQQKATSAKEKRVPRDEYLAAFYMIAGKPETKNAKYGIPAAALKKAAVAACSFVQGTTKVFARGAFHVLEEDNGMVELRSKSGPRMREDTVRLSGPGNALDLRYRPEFKDWSCEFLIQYDATAISTEQIVNLFAVAGFSVGLHEWRPQKDGSHGMFVVKTS